MKIHGHRGTFLWGAVLLLFIFVLPCCGGGGDEDVFTELPANYVGSLTLHFTSQYPTVDETTKVDAKVSKKGVVTFGSGTMHWEAENQLEEGKTKWVASFNLNPTGVATECGTDYCIQVNENTSFTETIEQYVLMNGDWKKVADDTENGTWNGGLAFSLNEASLDGSVVSASSDQGSATWTLALLPTLE